MNRNYTGWKDDKFSDNTKNEPSNPSETRLELKSTDIPNSILSNDCYINSSIISSNKDKGTDDIHIYNKLSFSNLKNEL